MPELPDDLLGPGVDLAETHISWVFLTATDVYKVKKSVDLGFLDFRGLDQRRRACEAEVELNRRLAPAVYLGVVAVTRGPDGHLRLGGDGAVADWAVHMRRLPEARRADVLLAAQRLGRRELTWIAERIAVFHFAAHADAATAAFGAPSAIAENVRENFSATRAAIDAYLSPPEAAEIERWQLDFLERRRDLFERRVAGGRVRDGHGDLRLEHVYLPDAGDGGAAPAAGARAPEIVILDCIEFAERFRYADVCADVAFLAMDLAAHGRSDLAEHFLARYARAANDFDLYPLVDFYESYRAYVRGKVAAIVAGDDRGGSAARASAGIAAHRAFKLALASERRSLLAPMVIAVAGPIGSGKSTVAEWIAEGRSAPVVDTDRTRKSLLGVAPTQKVWDPPFAGSYTAHATDRVYDEMLRRAGAVLESGRAVILDASFRSRAERAAVKNLARERGVAFLLVECAATEATLRRRLEQRARTTGVSDGRLEILDSFLAEWEPIAELPADQHLQLDTERPEEECRAALRSRIEFWPERLPG